MATATGTMIDKATAFKNSVVGANLNKIVCKASSREILGPKKKHVDFLIHTSNDLKVSMPMLADYFSERFRATNWIVVFKALISTHNVISLGNERFLQCLATRPNYFNLESFQDRSDQLAADMSVYIRHYSRYLNLVCGSYRTLAMDVCRVTKGETGMIRKLETAKLLKTAPQIHMLLEGILECNMQISELTNGVINTAFLMLYKDLIKLYHGYNDAMINLLEKFFEMKKAEAKEALVIYSKFVPVCDRVKEFLQVAKDVGIDRNGTLDLKQVPADLLLALENHIKEMDGGKKLSTATQPAVLLAASPGGATPDKNSPALDRHLLEEQKKRLESFKQSFASPPKDTQPSSVTVPRPVTTTTSTTASSSSAADDLIGLDSTAMISNTLKMQSTSPWPSTSPTPSAQPAAVQPVKSFDPWAQMGGGYEEVNIFAPQTQKQQQGFNSAFPTTSSAVTNGTSSFGTSGGDILQPTVAHSFSPSGQPVLQQKPRNLGSNLETGLNTAVENLSLGLEKPNVGVSPQKSQHQWKPPTSVVKTGGPNWQPSIVQTSTLPPAHPMMMPQSGMMGYGGMNPGYYGMGQPGFGSGATMMQQPMGMQGAAWGQQQMNFQGSQHTMPPQQQSDVFGPIVANQRPLF